jgi:hypothetical protein
MSEPAAKRAAAYLLLGLAVAVAAFGCGPPPPPATTAEKRASVASWADVFDGVPDLYAVVRPKAIKRDGVYGSLFRSLVRLAQTKTSARSDTMIEALEGADEIILGLGQGSDAALVVRGVPASLDPSKITDASGTPLFRVKSERTRVLEYELWDRKNAEAGGLFVLPADRTWVGALGSAFTRAREAFASPMNRPAPVLDRDALAVVRLAGRAVHMWDRHPSYGPLLRKATSATIALEPAKTGLAIAVEYPGSDSAAWAEMEAKRVIDELATAPNRTWLKDSTVRYEGTTLRVRLAIPPRLLEELPNASGADFLN